MPWTCRAVVSFLGTPDGNSGNRVKREDKASPSRINIPLPGQLLSPLAVHCVAPSR